MHTCRMKTNVLFGVLIFICILTVLVSGIPAYKETGIQKILARVKRANTLTKQSNVTKTIVRKEPAKEKDWRQEIHLTPLEIATIAAICLLIVGALLFCIYQYIAFCCRKKSKIQRVNSSESLTSGRNWKSLRRGSRDSDGRWSRSTASSSGSVDNWQREKSRWAF